MMLSLAFSGASMATAQAPQPDTIQFNRGVVVGPAGKYGRNALHTDAVEALLVAGTWMGAEAGDAITLADGSIRKWATLDSDEDGWFRHDALHRGYLYTTVKSPSARIMILNASGHRFVYVNGALRAGDPYGNGLLRVPVRLRRGTNHFLFQGARGSVRATLTEPTSTLVIAAGDETLPDLITGQSVAALGAVVVLNCTLGPLEGGTIRCASGDRRYTGEMKCGPIPPLGLRKIPFKFSGPPPAAETNSIDVNVTVEYSSDDGQLSNSTSLSLAVKQPNDVHKRTFISAIDGSVQYYAVNPAQEPSPQAGLVLSLHGAGVEAIGQARSYASKSGLHIVCPTNRRPFGFDWEDWGALDALEVLDEASRQLKPDAARIYLTGHSMGGHGVWQLAATFPDRFAALGPSAGWISFWSYGGKTDSAPQDGREQILRRASSPSDTLAMSRNYLQHGIYILHGANDDNVPVTEARHMRDHLQTFHPRVVYHEQPGAGHWWDASDAPGVDCVDWAPMFDFFANQRIPDSQDMRSLQFVITNPAISSSCHWVTIEAQEQPLGPSKVTVHPRTDTQSISVDTENVARLSFDLRVFDPDKDIAFTVDEQDLVGLGPRLPPTPRLWLERRNNHWQILREEPDSKLKGPLRYGPFKQVFKHQPVLVYGTGGSADENAWSLAKARFDAETFYYRGNGAFDVIADQAFNPDVYKDHNLVLYGNARTNSAWSQLLPHCPVVLKKGSAQIGQHLLTGENLAALFIYPRKDHDERLIGVVGGTGLAGMRLTNHLPYFVSGIAYPDCILLSTQVLSDVDQGLLAAGIFGIDWSIKSGHFAFRPEPATP